MTASPCETATQHVHIPLLYCVWLCMKNSATGDMNKEQKRRKLKQTRCKKHWPQSR